jgi:hypothetical protein
MHIYEFLRQFLVPWNEFTYWITRVMRVYMLTVGNWFQADSALDHIVVRHPEEDGGSR